MIPFLLWNRIIGSSLRERIAAADALKRQPAALDRAVFLDGLDRVLRAGRDIPAAGSSPAAAASCPSCRNLVVLQGAQQRFFDFLIACAYGPYPCDQHKVDAVGKFVLVETVRLTKQTLDAVSFHRTRQLGTDGESQPVVAELVPAAVDHNVFSCRGHTTMIQSAEFVVFL